MTDYTTIILVTLVGFIALAALLLVPVDRFITRAEQASRKWTTRHEIDAAGGPNGSPTANGAEHERNGR